MLRLCIQILAAAAACFSALVSITLLIRLRWPAPAFWILKIYTSALSPFLFAMGLLCILVGFTTDSLFISIIGIYNALIFLIHIIGVTSAPDSSSNFERAFGLEWETRIYSELKSHFLPTRRIFRLPKVPDPRMEQNISFSTIPGTGRKLLCDLWQPPENVMRSGLTFIYLHGGAWYLLDKDTGTRPFFSYLAAQGHVIMDLAYRLAPETDMMGMVNDVKRAIGWIKENASAYQLNPNRIVLGGGSSGGHLALLSAYTSNNPQFTPRELEGKDLGVCAVISLYGPADLKAMYYHTSQHLTTRSTPGSPKKAVPTKMPAWIIKKMGKDYDRLGMNKGFENAGAFAPLLGGHPDECPETYALFSPVTHVHSGCPPTLLIHGEHDLMAPVKATRFLHKRLTEERILTVMHILPQTDHAFDLIQPKTSPAAHNAFYDVERFISLMV